MKHSKSLFFPSNKVLVTGNVNAFYVYLTGYRHCSKLVSYLNTLQENMVFVINTAFVFTAQQTGLPGAVDQKESMFAIPSPN